jgi:hypothetical protein
MSPESSDGIRLAQILETISGRILAGSGQKIPARTVGSLPTSRDLAKTAYWPDSSGSDSFGRNSANPDLNEIVRIPAFISNFGYSS